MLAISWSKPLCFANHLSCYSVFIIGNIFNHEKRISFTCIFEFTAHNMQRDMPLSLDNYSSPSLGKWKCSDLPSSANMGRSTVNYQQSLAHIYHIMIIVTGGFSKIAGLTAFNFTSPSSQKRLQHKCFPENIAKFLRTAFFIQHLWWLLLSVW